MTITAPRPTTYQPSDDDHLIFQWVKMEGRPQQEVASMLAINQSTVSRVIQRYERWQAHLKDRENGRLDPKERLRAQRSLAYERNELIIASCLRIADKMEGFTELSKSTTSRPSNELLNKREVRTEERVIDRHGVAARFLRLAYRINMEQLKLAKDVAYDTDAPAEPLTDEELAEQDRQAAEDAAELAAARQRAREWRADNNDPPHDDSLPGSSLVTQDREGPPSPIREPLTAAPTRQEPRDSGFPGGSLGTSSTPSPVPSPPSPAPPLHNLHNENLPEIAASRAQSCTCTQEIRLDKNSQPCITRPLPTRSVSEGPPTQARRASEGPRREVTDPPPDNAAHDAFACADPVRALE